MLKAVVFDLDGTLIDSTDAIIDSFIHTFDVIGVTPPDRQAIHDSISVPLEAQFALLTDRDPVELSAIYRTHYFETCTGGTILLPDVTETLQRFRELGLRMAIATSKSLRGSEILLNHLRIADFFEFVVGADSVTHHKPHPEALELSMSKLEIDASQMVYVGDTRFDTEASKRAGVDCVAVATGYATREELVKLQPAHVADSLEAAGVYIIRSYFTESGILLTDSTTNP